MYALFTKPDLFQGYVADSPTVDAVWNLEREFATSGRTTAGRVYMSFAENEWSYYAKQIRAFHDRMTAHHYVKGGLELRRVDRVRHGAGSSESYMQGLLFVAAPIAPEQGVQTDMYTDPGGRTGYLLNFWPTPQWAAMPETDRSQLWREHTVYLAGLPASKPGGLAVVSPRDSTRRDSGAVVFAVDRSEAVAMAAAAPSVKSGILTYEVLPEADN